LSSILISNILSPTKKIYQILISSYKFGGIHVLISNFNQAFDVITYFLISTYFGKYEYGVNNLFLFI